MSTHNLCFEQKYEKYQNFLCEKLPFFSGKIFSVFNRRVFVMAHVDDPKVGMNSKNMVNFIFPYSLAPV